jgi:hypothetical protein
MNRRQLFLSTTKAALLSAFGGTWLSGKASAQGGGAVSEGVIHGTLGSPDATISLDGRVLPPAPPAFGGVMKESYKESTPWWPPRPGEPPTSYSS